MNFWGELTGLGGGGGPGGRGSGVDVADLPSGGSGATKGNRGLGTVIERFGKVVDEYKISTRFCVDVWLGHCDFYLTASFLRCDDDDKSLICSSREWICCLILSI